MTGVLYAVVRFCVRPRIAEEFFAADEDPLVAAPAGEPLGVRGGTGGQGT